LTNVSPLSAWTTRAEAVANLVDRFERSGIECPDREARKTLCAASGISTLALMVAPEETLGSAVNRAEEFAARRAAGEPLSRIIGRREFWGLPLTITPQVLDPRPETETIVEQSTMIWRHKRQQPLHILDLGVGSGALLCALLTEFINARGVGADICPDAVKVARKNIEICGLAGRAEIQLGDWTRGLKGRFDLIVSNPPYIPTGDLLGLSPEVRNFDPPLALDGGFDGLDAYRRIMPETRSILSADGRLLVEIGANQATAVLAIGSNCGLIHSATYRDLGGLDRVVVVRSSQTSTDRDVESD
jgi:release factor glutamine methyltransferase